MAVRTNKTVVVGAANTYSKQESRYNEQLIDSPETDTSPRGNSCVPCWHQARCELLSQTNHGMQAANDMLRDLISQFDQLQLAEMDVITKSVHASMYLGGGHYKGPVIDLKLMAMLHAIDLLEGRTQLDVDEIMGTVAPSAAPTTL